MPIDQEPGIYFSSYNSREIIELSEAVKNAEENEELLKNLRKEWFKLYDSCLDSERSVTHYSDEGEFERQVKDQISKYNLISLFKIESPIQMRIIGEYLNAKKESFELRFYPIPNIDYPENFIEAMKHVNIRRLYMKCNQYKEVIKDSSAINQLRLLLKAIISNTNIKELEISSVPEIVMDSEIKKQFTDLNKAKSLSIVKKGPLPLPNKPDTSLPSTHRVNSLNSLRR